MEKEISKTKNSNEKKSWSKTIEKNGITETVKVEEVENGFLITKSKWGRDIDSKSPDKYIDECKKYISNVNPILDEEDELDKALKMFE